MEITFLPKNTSEIHLHVEQLLQNTYWTLAEDLRPPKRQETPTYLSKAKGKRKNRDKRIGMGPAPVGGSCEGGKFPHTRKPLHGQRLRVAEVGSFGATEESTATGVRRAKRRDSRAEDRCQLALSSPRGSSAPPPGQAGAGSWGSGFGWIPGRGLGLAWTQPEGG